MSGINRYAVSGPMLATAKYGSHALLVMMPNAPCPTKHRNAPTRLHGSAPGGSAGVAAVETWSDASRVRGAYIDWKPIKTMHSSFAKRLATVTSASSAPRAIRPGQPILEWSRSGSARYTASCAPSGCRCRSRRGLCVRGVGALHGSFGVGSERPLARRNAQRFGLVAARQSGRGDDPTITSVVASASSSTPCSPRGCRRRAPPSAASPIRCFTRRPRAASCRRARRISGGA